MRKNNTTKTNTKETVKPVRVGKRDKRAEKFAKRREEGKTYVYKSNPYEAGTKEYYQEEKKRACKNVDRKTPVARWTSIMARLDNQLRAAEARRKELKSAKKNK